MSQTESTEEQSPCVTDDDRQTDSEKVAVNESVNLKKRKFVPESACQPARERCINIANVNEVSSVRKKKRGPKKSQKIYTVLLTGGPCGGKTSALAALQDEITRRGLHTIVVPESATTVTTMYLYQYLGLCI